MLNQQFIDAMFHLGKFVVEYKTAALEVVITEDAAVVHLIPVDAYQELDEEGDDE